MIGAHTLDILEFTDGRVTPRALAVIREIGLTVVVNQIPLVRLACTGKWPAYLAAGFLFSCGVVNAADDILDLTVAETPDGYEAAVRVRDAVALPTQTVTSGLGRNYQIATSDQRVITPPVGPLWSPTRLMELTQELNSRCELYRLTRGCHNASLCDEHGIVLFREDIGRHNAIDTIVGQCLLEGRDTSRSLILSTGRIASEIVQKVVRANIPLLVSTAVATGLAVQTARLHRLGLVGNIRSESLWIYHDNGILDLHEPQRNDAT